MSPVPAPRSYGMSAQTFAMLCIFLIAIFAMGAVKSMTKGEDFLLFTAFALTAGFVWMAIRTRMHVGHRAVTTTGPVGTTTIRYEDVVRAWIGAADASGKARGADNLWLQARDGGRLRISLRMYSVTAVAHLVTALEAEGVAIDVSDDPIAQRVGAKVRAAQQLPPVA
jgi:hypothetical protein